MASAIKLSRDASTQTLDSAIRSQSPIVLESTAFPNVTINGFLISGNETTLLMEVTGRPALDPAKLEGSQCTVHINGKLIAYLNRHGEILRQDYDEESVRLDLRLPAAEVQRAVNLGGRVVST